ncbi:MAG: hypothetical protein ACFFKA_21315, partial [Candidatus Thorarchaeota archaeon]
MRIRKRLLSLFLRLYSVKVKEIVVDHNKYLGKKYNSTQIYKEISSNCFISPFNITFDEIDKLMMIDFKGDEAYYSIELQIIQVEDTEYPLVILYRKDGLMDLYYTNPRTIEKREDFIKDLLPNISFNQSDFIDYYFIVDTFGLSCYLYLTDKFNRTIEFKVEEHCPDKTLT